MSATSYLRSERSPVTTTSLHLEPEIVSRSKDYLTHYRHAKKMSPKSKRSSFLWSLPLAEQKSKELGNSFRWVFTKAEFDRFQLELRKHKESLHIMLSVCGRRNDIQLRKQTKSVQQNLHGFQTSTLRQSQALHTTTQMSAQSFEGSFNRHQRP